MSDDDDDDDTPRYPVHWIYKAIRKERELDDGTRTKQWHYMAHWYGYNQSADTLEPESHFDQCPDLLERFWEHLGGPHLKKGSKSVYVVHKSFIENEKNNFSPVEDKDDELSEPEGEKGDTLEPLVTTAPPRNKGGRPKKKRRGPRPGWKARKAEAEAAAGAASSSATGDHVSQSSLVNTSSTATAVTSSSTACNPCSPPLPVRRSKRRRAIVEDSSDGEDEETLASLKKKRTTTAPPPDDVPVANHVEEVNVPSCGTEANETSAPSTAAEVQPPEPPLESVTDNPISTTSSHTQNAPFDFAHLEAKTANEPHSTAPPSSSQQPSKISPVAKPIANDPAHSLSDSPTVSAPPTHTTGLSKTVAASGKVFLANTTQQKGNSGPSSSFLTSAPSKPTDKHRGSKVHVINELPRIQRPKVPIPKQYAPTPAPPSTSQRPTVNLMFPKKLQDESARPDHEAVVPSAPELADGPLASNTTVAAVSIPIIGDVPDWGDAGILGEAPECAEKSAHADIAGQTNANSSPLEGTASSSSNVEATAIPLLLQRTARSVDLPTDSSHPQVEAAMAAIIEHQVNGDNRLAVTAPQEKRTWSGDLKLTVPSGQKTLLPIELLELSTISPTDQTPVLDLFDVLKTHRHLNLEKSFGREAYLRLVRPAFGRPLGHLLVGSNIATEHCRLQALSSYLRDTDQIGLGFMDGPSDTSHQIAVILYPPANITLHGAPALSQMVNRPLIATFVHLLHHERISIILESLSDHSSLVTTQSHALKSTAPLTSGPAETRPPDPLHAEIPRFDPQPPHTGGQHRVQARQALSLLQLTTDEIKLFCKKTFCMFPDQQDLLLPADAHTVLKFMLQTPKARRVPADDMSAQVVLIHASGMTDLHRFPHLHERTRQRATMFFTYGWGPNIYPRQSPQLQAIFPLGGIMTFTPRAIVTQPITVQKLLYSIETKPFWEIVVTPSTLAMAWALATAPQLTGGIPADPLSAIVVLRLAKYVLNTVPDDDSTQSLADSVEWALEQMDLSKADPPQTVNQCMVQLRPRLQALGIAPGLPLKPALEQLTAEQRLILEMQVEDEALTNFRTLQLQPAMHQFYRRFVIASHTELGLGSATSPLPVELRAIESIVPEFTAMDSGVI